MNLFTVPTACKHAGYTRTSYAARGIPMMITCKSCVLRPLVIDDAPTFARHANDRAIWLNLRDRFPHPYTLADAGWWINHITSKPVVTDFGIIVDGEAAGSISLMPCSDVERVSAELGYWLGRAFWGRGIATEAVAAVTKYAFEQLNLTRVFAIPYAHNASSFRVLEKAGYQLEGRMRKSAIKDGVVIDQLLYATIREDWEAHSPD